MGEFAKTTFITRRALISSALLAGASMAIDGNELASLVQKLDAVPHSESNNYRIADALRELEDALVADGWGNVGWQISVRDDRGTYLMLDDTGWSFI